MLAHDKESVVKTIDSFDPSISADEELDVVREQVARAREDNDPRIEPTLDISEIDSLLGNAFSAELEKDAEADLAQGLTADMSDDALLDAVLFDDEPVAGTESSPEVSASTIESSDLTQPSLLEAQGESSGDDLSAAPGAGSGATDPLAQGAAHGPDAINAAFAAAQRQQGADTMEHIAHAQAAGPAGNQQAQRVEVGIIQGMSMLGGAGLAGLTQMLRAGGSSLNNSINTRKYGKLSGEVDALTKNMDGILDKFAANGFMAGINGLSGNNKAEFVKEFMATPANKQMFDDLLHSVGTLSTKAGQAAATGAAAGLSGDQLDIEISRKIKNVSDKHQEMLDSLHDHNGTKLGDRLSDLVDQVASFLKSVYNKVTETFGFSQRQGM